MVRRAVGEGAGRRPSASSSRATCCRRRRTTRRWRRAGARRRRRHARADVRRGAHRAALAAGGRARIAPTGDEDLESRHRRAAARNARRLPGRVPERAAAGIDRRSTTTRCAAPSRSCRRSRWRAQRALAQSEAVRAASMRSSSQSHRLAIAGGDRRFVALRARARGARRRARVALVVGYRWYAGSARPRRRSRSCASSACTRARSCVPARSRDRQGGVPASHGAHRRVLARARTPSRAAPTSAPPPHAGVGLAGTVTTWRRRPSAAAGSPATRA